MDRNRICRLCAEFWTTEQLTSLDDPSRCIRKKLFRCSQINLLVDENYLLPQNVCDDCVDKLEQSWSFAEKVAKTQEKLQEQFAGDPLADIKVEVECVGKPSSEFLSAFGAVTKEDEHVYVNSGLEGTHPVSSKSDDNLDPIDVVQAHLDENPSMSSGQAVLPEESLLTDVVDEVFVPRIHQKIDSNDERQVTKSIPTPSAHIRSATVRKGAETINESINNSIGKNEKDYWAKVLAFFRNILNIKDEDYCEDGTISERGHPELLELSWKMYKWKCFKCRNYFVNEGSLESHVEKQHNGTVMKYCCSDCDKIFEFLASLKSHIYLTHRPVLRFW